MLMLMILIEQTSLLEFISRKIFSAHFGQLSIIFLWISGMHFHGAYFFKLFRLNDQLELNKVHKLYKSIVGLRNFKWRCWW